MRLAVPLILVGLLAIGLGLFWLRVPGADSLEHAPAFTPLAEPLWPIPGQAERRFPAELEYKLELLDPASDGSDIEVLASEDNTGPADGSALFADFTSSVLGQDRAYLEQLVPGRAQWGAALDVAFGDQLLGHQGLAVGDVNGDGLDDVFVAQGGGLPDRLFVQELDGTARDQAGWAGVDYLDGTTSALLLDLDNDGDQDLVTASGPILLHSNDGKGRFTRETTVPTSTVHSMTAADYDADGDLDLYACKYGSPERNPPRPYHDARNGVPDVMLRNDGHWHFTDVTREIGLDENNRRYGLAASWADYDADGDPDLHVANDFGRDNLYRNDGGKFHDVAASAGFADSGAGSSSTWGDYNQDGHLDLYVSNQRARGNSLYENLGDGTFRDVSSEAGVTRGRWANSSKFVDFDNDGLEDILVVNGYVTNDDPQELADFFRRQVAAQSADDRSYADGWAAVYELVRQGKSWGGRERDVCFMNSGTPRFADVSAVCGLDSAGDGRGLAVVDWDLDGALDLWVSSRTGPQLRFLRNLKKTAHHFVAVRLEGRRCNRDAIGARVELYRPAGRPLVRVLHGGDGYLSQSTKWLHFGLGESTAIDRLVVRWPGGATEEFSGLSADRRFSLVQGSGSAREWTPPRAAPVLPASPPIEPPQAVAIRTYLAARLPLPPLDFTGEAGDPWLISLWASECEACRQQLTDLRDARERLARSGLRVLALGVDDEARRPAARELLESLGWPFDQGYAGRDLLDVLSIVRQTLLDLPGGMALPTHFLVDRQRELAAVYRGPLVLDTLLDDAASLDLDPGESRDRATPFPGRWARPPVARRSTDGLARLLRSRGHSDLAAFYAAGLEMPNLAPQPARERRAEVFEVLGRSLAAEGKSQDATSAYARGLEIDPLRASLHHAMGQSLVALKRLDGAIRHLEHAVRLDPEGAAAHFDLGSAYVQRARIEDGVLEFHLAAELSEPGSATRSNALYNLGVAHDAQGQPEQGLEYVERALAEEPELFDAWRFLGRFHQQRKEWPSAIDAYRKALQSRPEEPQTLFQLGLVHIQAGDPAAARRQHDVLQRVSPPLAAQLLKAIEAR